MGEVRRMGMTEGDAGADGGVEKVARDEDEGAVGPSGVGVVGGDGGLQLWGRVLEGDCGVTSGPFGFNELHLDCPQLLLAFLALCEV